MEITKNEFKVYEEVRRSGVTNMFNATTVNELSGLSKDAIFFIMENYDKLTEQYPDVIED